MTYILNDKINPKPLTALYNRGAFDGPVEDNNDGTINVPRQTLYYYGKDFLNSTIYTNQAGNPYLALAIPLSSTSNVKANCPIVGADSWWNVTFSVVTVTFDSNNSNLIIMLPNGSTNTSAIQSLEIQIKAEKVLYTDTLIKNQPVSTLDQAGCEWERKEYEKTTNLCGLTAVNKGYAGNGDLNAVGYGITKINSSTFSFYRNATSQNSYMVCYLDLNQNLKPNTTYHIKITGFNFQDIHIFIDGVKIFTQTGWLWTSNGTTINLTFTMPSSFSSYNIQLITQFNTSAIATKTCQIMLNEGSWVLPYQPYDDFNAFSKNEHNRTINVLEGVTRTYGVEVNFDTGATVGASQNHSIMDFDVKASTSYYLKKASGGTYRVAFYQDTTYLGWVNITESITFTTPSNCNWARISLYYVDITPVLSAGGAVVHEIDLANGWPAIISSNTMTIRYSKIGDLKMMFFSFDNHPISQIGETIYTVDFNAYPQLAHSRIIRCINGGDIISGSNTVGRVSVGIDFKTNGNIDVFPEIENQATGSCDIRLYGDSMMWFI